MLELFSGTGRMVKTIGDRKKDLWAIVEGSREGMFAAKWESLKAAQSRDRQGL